MQRGINNRRIATVAALALSATLLAGCTQSEAGSNGDVTITVGYYAEAGGPADSTMKELISQFEGENPGINVEVESANYDDFYKRLTTQLAGGTAPEVWLQDGALVQEYAGRGSLRDLSDFVTPELEEATLGLDILRAGDSKGRLFGFPQGAQVGALFYNTAMFEAAGIAPPSADWTYEDLQAAAKKLTKDTNGDGKPEVYGLRSFSPSFPESWWPMIKAFGGEILDEEGNVAIDSPESLKALEWLASTFSEGVSPDPVTTDALGGSQGLFSSGVVAMQYGIYARIQTANKGDIEYEVAPLPLGPGGTGGESANVNSWVINAASEDAEAKASWKWIDFFAGKGPQTAWAQIGEAIPINRAVAESDAFLSPGSKPGNRQVFLDALDGADDLDLNPVWSEYTTAIRGAITAGVRGDMPLDEALEKAQSDAQRAIDRFTPAK